MLDDAEPIYAGPDPVLVTLASYISKGLQTLQNQGFSAIRQAWLERAARLGELITVNLGEEEIRGTFETLSENGALQLRLSDGTLRDILAGDVLL
jgi:BirA family biotin operon repressor/biotin-[acetyl-CoA-carboxylase] ligase